ERRKPKPSESTSTTPSPMMSTSLVASCLRMANISSCLRIVLAFSTWCSSAKASNSVGDLTLRSWSFISRIGGPGRKSVAKKTNRRGRGGTAGLGCQLEASDPMSRPILTDQGDHLPAFGEMVQTYEKSSPGARGLARRPRRFVAKRNVWLEWLYDGKDHDRDH